MNVVRPLVIVGQLDKVMEALNVSKGRRRVFNTIYIGVHLQKWFNEVLKEIYSLAEKNITSENLKKLGSLFKGIVTKCNQKIHSVFKSLQNGNTKQLLLSIIPLVAVSYFTNRSHSPSPQPQKETPNTSPETAAVK